MKVPWTAAVANSPACLTIFVPGRGSAPSEDVEDSDVVQCEASVAPLSVVMESS